MIKPMLAASFPKDSNIDEELPNLRYPILTSPKLDGIRVLCHPTLGPVSRSLKPIANIYIRTLLSSPAFHHLDGEVIVGDHESPAYSFSATSSAVMSQAGEPDFTYLVFDSFEFPELAFHKRLAVADARVRLALIEGKFYVRYLAHIIVASHIALRDLEEAWLSAGYEGAMIRDLQGTYKFGRSTYREGGLIKLKRFDDAEATIIGFVELERNCNVPTQNELGYQTRSDHKAGMEPAGTLGALLVRGIGDPWEGVTFQIGSGFDQATRDLYWASRHTLINETVNYKYQRIGSKDAPRMPIFRGLRGDLT